MQCKFNNIFRLFIKQYKYFRSRNSQTEMYAGRVACCSLVSHVEYAPRDLLRLQKDGTDRRTDGRRTVTLGSRLDAARIMQ